MDFYIFTSMSRPVLILKISWEGWGIFWVICGVILLATVGHGYIYTLSNWLFVSWIQLSEILLGLVLFFSFSFFN